MKNNVSEKAFQNHVIQYAKSRSWLVYHTYDSRRSTAGFPDLVLIRDRILFRELKTDAGRLSKAQQAFGEKITKAGGDWCVWRPSMIKEIYKELS